MLFENRRTDSDKESSLAKDISLQSAANLPVGIAIGRIYPDRRLRNARDVP